MTTAVKIHVNGQYRTTVRQTSQDGSIEETVIEGNYNGGPGEHTFYLRHPATGIFEISEVYVKDEDKKEHDGKAFATHRIHPT